MYADHFYYLSEYGGELIPLEKFAKAEKKAEAYIRHLTYMHGDIFACENDTVKDAVCAVAEIYYSCDLKNQQGKWICKVGKYGRIQCDLCKRAGGRRDDRSGRIPQSLRSCTDLSASAGMAVQEGGIL